MSSSHGSITKAIQASDGDDESMARLIWDRFFAQLCAYAQQRIYQRHRGLIEPDEIASTAFMALVQGLREKRFERVRNRDELWQLLTLIAARKTINAQRRLDCEKRGGGQLRGGSAFGPEGINGVVDFIQRDLAPDVGAQLQELSCLLLQSLPGESIRQIAIWRMAGWSNSEIATELGCAERTVERKLNLIRKIWSETEFE